MPTWEVRTADGDYEQVTADYMETSEQFVDFMRVTTVDASVVVLRVPAGKVAKVKLSE